MGCDIQPESMVVCCILSMSQQVLTFIIDFCSFHNRLKHLCSLNLVSILTATLWKVVIKFKIAMFFNFLSSFSRLHNFISTKMKHPPSLFFSVVLSSCQIHLFNGVIPCQIIQNFWIMSSLSHGFFEIFTSDRYHRDMKTLKILVSNLHHFRIYGIFKKCQIGVPRLIY